MFPIHTRTGRVAGFSGRAYPGPDEKKYGKYVNSPETAIFKKSNLFFGYHKALWNIKGSKKVILTEGQADVIRLHQIGVENAIAPLGTSLTKDHIKELSSYSKSAILIFDGDNAGIKAMKRAGKMMLESGFSVNLIILDPEEDSDSLFQNIGIFNKYLKNAVEYIDYTLNIEFDKLASDPTRVSDVVETTGKLLSMVDNEVLRMYHLDSLSTKLKKFKIQKSLISKTIKRFSKNEEYIKESDSESLPAYLGDEDRRAYYKYGFYEGLEGKDVNQYFFGPGEWVSNFVIIPIFHIMSSNSGMTRKLFELLNMYGESVKLEINMDEITSLAKFRKKIESAGNMYFQGNEFQFLKIRRKLYDNTRYCQAIDNPGWQKEGFWAWANGIQIEDEEFIPIDENGIVTFNDKNFFLPAFSDFYVRDKSVYMDERKFRYLERDITLYQWNSQFLRVFGENAMVMTAYLVAALFFDHIFHLFKHFPLLNLYGPKGTGKSQAAMSLSYMFGIKQDAYNIHNGTKAGLADHLQRFNNAISWIDEYKNSIDFEKIEGLKSIYDAVGRSRLNKDFKKETTQVNSPVMVSGQEMPTADIALFSRLLFLQFIKDKYTKQEKADYDKLKNMERDGLSHITNEIIQKRSEFVKNYYDHYLQVLSSVFSKLEKKNIEDRILKNWVEILAAFSTIEGHFDFAFNYLQLEAFAIEQIQVQNGQISKSSEIGIFWQTVESMFDDNLLIEGWHFKVTYEDSVRLKQQDRLLNFEQPKHLLKMKFNSISSMYLKAARQMGIKPIPIDSLRHYLENSSFFIGYTAGDRYKNRTQNIDGSFEPKVQRTTSMCFDYDMLNINLIRESEVPVPEPSFDDDQDAKLPFSQND
jgi:DNA primase